MRGATADTVTIFNKSLLVVVSGGVIGHQSMLKNVASSPEKLLLISELGFVCNSIMTEER